MSRGPGIIQRDVIRFAQATASSSHHGWISIDEFLDGRDQIPRRDRSASSYESARRAIGRLATNRVIQRRPGRAVAFRSVDLADHPLRQIAAPALDGLDLSGIDLSRMTLSEFEIPRERNFAGSNLSGSDLTNADFQMAVLDGACLFGAKLRGATLRQPISLVATDFRNADMTGAMFRDADFRKCFWNDESQGIPAHKFSMERKLDLGVIRSDLPGVRDLDELT